MSLPPIETTIEPMLACCATRLSSVSWPGARALVPGRIAPSSSPGLYWP
jgi:hypothetical protein